MNIRIREFFIALAVLAGCTVNATVTFTITPSAVSNTYLGPITLQISNIPTGDTVVVQKFAIVNSNGVVAAGDRLAQQFDLTDGQAGMVIGGVTNINVPGDLNSATGAITATLNFPGDFPQEIIGQYGYVLSSAAGHFAPITNLFTVTNFPYAQKITGSVTSSGGNIPYAGVLLFPAPVPGHDMGNPVGGTVANGSGAYSILVPAGTYVPFAFQSNYVANYSTSPVLTLTNTQVITTNLSLTVATAHISGKAVDADNSSLVLPGLFVPANGANGLGNKLIAIASTDTNGNFNMGVTSGSWKFSGNPEGLALHGYVAYDDGTNLNAGATGFVGGFYKATALFYGTIQNSQGNPLPGIAIEAYDNNDNEFDTDGYSDASGNYVSGAVGGLGSNDPWVVDVDNASSFPNDVFSQPAIQQNGGTNLAIGKAVLINFTAIVATNEITGHVQFDGTNVVGVQVDAYATIGAINYNATSVDTDTNGNYSLNVGNGAGGTIWTVNVYDCGCSDSDSLNNVIDGGNYQGDYQDPASQSVTIDNDNGTANFTVLPNGSGQIFGYVTDTDGDPVAGVNVDANDGMGDTYTNSTDGSGYYTFNVANGNWDISVDCGGLTVDGYQCVSDQNVTVSSGNESVEQDFTVQFNSLQITTPTTLNNGTNGTFYSQTFQATGGTPPYSWYIPDYSGPPPANLSLSTNGVLSGTLSDTAQPYYFSVGVTDSVENTNEVLFTLNVVNPPLVITNTSLPNGNVGVSYATQLGATGGQSPYTWQLALGSASPPPGLSLNPSGLISGIPTTNKAAAFKVQVNDFGSDVTNKVFSIAINPDPILGSPGWRTNRFFMLLNAASNQNYTLQMSTNLVSTNWTTILVTNNATTNSYMVTDPNATNKQGYYRVFIGP